MGVCEGKIYCKIYRDKRFCSKAKVGNYEECDCRHASLRCDIAWCAASNICPVGRYKNGQS